MVMMPSWTLTPMNWKDGYDWKMQTLKYRHQNSYISITRDRDTGSVFPDKSTGQPTIAYTPSKFDSAHTMEGVIAVAKLCYVQNAQEIHVFISGNEPFYRYPDGVCGETAAEMDVRFERWCDSVRAGGNAPPKGIWASAHQMGTNRMATNEKDGVVDANGKVFGTEGLYVSDASVFPSASGVNPMITNMAISDYISTGIAKLLHSEKV
jgi:choline dehydrogenase-like flavoprotein